MAQRTSEQPYNWDEENDATRVLPTTEDSSSISADTAPTRLIAPVQQDDATQVLSTQSTPSEDPTVPLPSHRRVDTDATRIMPAQRQAPRSALRDPATSHLAPQVQSQRNQPHYNQAQQSAASSVESPTPSRGLQTLRPSNIRQTRPTAWAMFQHIMTLITLLLLLWATIVFFVQTSVGQILDETAFDEFSYQFLGYQEQTMKVLDWIPAAAGIIAVIGLIFVLVWKHRFVPALIGVAVALCANLSAQYLKNYLITKPDFGIQQAALNSAPSGHTTFAAAAGAALFLASPKKLRPTVALLGAVFTIAAGFSTVVNGWHRPSDVISAIFLTGAWTVIGLMILRFMRSEELDMSNTQRSGLILIPLATITCFFMGFCALALYLVNAYDPFPGATLAAASCLIISASTFTTSMLVSLLRPQNKQRKAYTKVWTY